MARTSGKRARNAASGVRALLQAWEAAVAGIPAEQAAKDSPELTAALAAFGG
jgi:ribulose-bisphosphate carboxylase large chain